MRNATNARAACLAGIVGSITASGAIAGGQCPADLNGDGNVNSIDFDLVLDDWGQNGQGLLGDITGDGEVDIQDIAEILLRYGQNGTCLSNFPGNGAYLNSIHPVDNSSVRLGQDTFDPAFDGGITHFTFEVDAVLEEPAAWLGSSITVTLYQHVPYEIYQNTGPFSGGDNLVTSQALLQITPALAFDTGVDVPYDSDFASIEPAGSVVSTSKVYSVPLWTKALPLQASAPTKNEPTIARFTIVRTDGGFNDPVLVADPYCQLAEELGTVEVFTETGGFSTVPELDSRHLVLKIIENPVVADANSDLFVDTADLGILISNYGTSYPYTDFNHDGVVDTADLGILISEYGQSCLLE